MEFPVLIQYLPTAVVAIGIFHLQWRQFDSEVTAVSGDGESVFEVVMERLNALDHRRVEHRPVPAKSALQSESVQLDALQTDGGWAGDLCRGVQPHQGDDPGALRHLYGWAWRGNKSSCLTVFFFVGNAWLKIYPRICKAYNKCWAWKPYIYAKSYTSEISCEYQFSKPTCYCKTFPYCNYGLSTS